MASQGTFGLLLRSQGLTRDGRGRAFWQVVERERVVPAEQTAIIVCDMWDTHWCRGAAERVDEMAPRMNEALAAAREKGARIIHAPSETMDFYAGTPARKRMHEGRRVDPPPSADRPDPPLPIDDSDEGPDTGETSWSTVWTRQHPALVIDQELDGISDEGLEVYSFLRREGIEQTLIMGVHTNMCVLGRSFGIKRMVNWGVSIALVRDLTDAMYNPARPPYVSHDEGTRLVVSYIEKFWCPTVAGEQLLS
jgi:nicotinamidase-related amidase